MFGAICAAKQVCCSVFYHVELFHSFPTCCLSQAEVWSSALTCGEQCCQTWGQLLCKADSASLFLNKKPQVSGERLILASERATLISVVTWCGSRLPLVFININKHRVLACVQSLGTEEAVGQIKLHLPKTGLSLYLQVPWR